MGIYDRDWYKEAMREREGCAKPRAKVAPRIYYAPRRPMTLVGKAILIMAALIAASIAWRYLR